MSLPYFLVSAPKGEQDYSDAPLKFAVADNQKGVLRTLTSAEQERELGCVEVLRLNAPEEDALNFICEEAQIKKVLSASGCLSAVYIEVPKDSSKRDLFPMQIRGPDGCLWIREFDSGHVIFRRTC